MRQYVFGAVALLLLVATVFGASAFTSAEVVRDATVNVEADNNSIITLEPGTVGDSATQATNGELVLDATPNAAGLNVESTFTYGDTADPQNSYMFNMTNADTNSKSFTVAYNNVVDAQGATAPIEFLIYDSAGTQVASVTPNSDGTFTAAAGSTYTVVVVVDTAGLDDGADLSGDLVITA